MVGVFSECDRSIAKLQIYYRFLQAGGHNQGEIHRGVQIDNGPNILCQKVTYCILAYTFIIEPLYKSKYIRIRTSLTIRWLLCASKPHTIFCIIATIIQNIVTDY